MKVLVLLNEGAGTLAGMEPDAARQRIESAFASAGADAEVRFVDPKLLEQQAREASHQHELDAIVAGGGDGTINTIANAVAGGRRAFGVLPLGTHNHFAKDLAVPLDLEEAIAALSRGSVVDLPVGEVNGRMFLNFSAIGFHPAVVAEREQQQKQSGRNKWLAMAVALLRVFNRMPLHFVRLSSRGHEVAHATPSIIVCNNAYQMKAFGVEAASVPERGLLNVYVATKPGALSVLWLMIRAALGTVHAAKHFNSMALPEIKVDTRRRRPLRVSIDGEVTTMTPPLRYRIREKPLRVLKPAAQPQVQDASGLEIAPA
ncbi:MAG TPA: diacylglycerol kinase family protein [Tepidisphaeraceae bacterium]|nr:diacylglycerol kinase family protein [Tepidisphaeraceae bacterium]